MTAIKRTHSMLSSAQKDRVKTNVASKIQHSTLLQACSNEGNNQPSLENSDTRSGSGHAEDFHNEENDQNSCPCNEYDVLLRHLRTCPDPQLQIPQEITDLSMHYNDIEESIKVIHENIHNLSTKELLIEVKRLSNFMTSDMSEMSQTLQHITQNYDSSLTFFKILKQVWIKLRKSTFTINYTFWCTLG